MNYISEKNQSKCIKKNSFGKKKEEKKNVFFIYKLYWFILYVNLILLFYDILQYIHIHEYFL